jgi:tetratricopeptide (TPR) repeat protein
MTDLDALRRHFRQALASDPAGAYRDWYRAQEELRSNGEAEASCALADDLWQTLASFDFPSPEARARFLHNAAVFFGSPGPSADLDRSRKLFDEALAHFEKADDGGWPARVRHNFATALANLGQSDGELAEAIALFERALEWRTSDQEIARGVTMHNLGLALRRRADLDPARSAEHLAASVRALEEAVAIRERQGLPEGLETSRRQLAITRERLASGSEDRDRFGP